MFQPWPAFVGLRYVRARSHRYFVSFITWVSLAGVALGVAALIVVLSVMNGFESELRDRLLSLGAHARVVAAGPAEGAVDPGLESRLRALPGVEGVAPYTELQALAVHRPDMLPLMVRGIDTSAEESVTRLAPMIVAGKLADLHAGSWSVVLGSALADQLGVSVGDKVTLLVPVASATAPPEPRLREFTVAAVFEAGLQEHDASLAFAALADVRAFAPQAEGASGWQLRFRDALAVPALMGAVRAAAPPGAQVHDWSEDNASYFRAIRIEKTMMSLILLLVVGVAAFNIVAMLVMVVSEKRTDIAILRTLGAAPGGVARVFLVQGLVIGWSGVLAGVALGILLARNVGSIVPFLERLLHFQFLDADVYYITKIPSELHPLDVAWIGLAALLLTLAATLYPALRAAATPPAAALRYE
jgi:lipoprotein-releasing system permease protein